MKTHKMRIEAVAERVRAFEKEYFRLWDWRTTEPSRCLRCFVYPGSTGLQEEISEAEYMAATGSTLTNAELEARCGQGDEMRRQEGRLEAVEKRARAVRYRDDFPPVLYLENGPDTEERIAAYKVALEKQGYDPSLPPLVIILDDIPGRDIERLNGGPQVSREVDSALL